jgi:hypothetical protein
MVLLLARAFFVLVGGGILLTAAVNLASGNSLTDPVFPLGIALGALMVAAGAWTTRAGTLPTVVVWLATLAVATSIVYVGVIVFDETAHGPDVWALYLVPSVLAGAAALRIAFARYRAGSAPVEAADAVDA